MDNFLWHNQASSPAVLRVYVSPKLIHSAEVFVDITNAFAKSTTESFPRALKNSLPGLRYPARSDRIVIYCASEAEYKNAIDWIRQYQGAGNSSKFDSMLPRATKPIDGLIGVSGSKQPQADVETMVQAGQEKHQLPAIEKSRKGIRPSCG